MGKEILYCLRCGEVMIYDKRDFWQCPKCGGEWWDDESKLREIESEQRLITFHEELREQIKWSLAKGYTEVLPLVMVIDPRSRGSSSKSRMRNKKVTKPLITERYFLN